MITLDLRLGNLINALDDNDRPIVSKVIALSDGLVDIDEYGSRVLFTTLDYRDYAPEQCGIEGVRISEDWLRKLGFEKISKNSFEYEKERKIKYALSSSALTTPVGFVSEIRYVHQLQNLFYFVTGKELETRY